MHLVGLPLDFLTFSPLNLVGLELHIFSRADLSDAAFFQYIVPLAIRSHGSVSQAQRIALIARHLVHLLALCWHFQSEFCDGQNAGNYGPNRATTDSAEATMQIAGKTTEISGMIVGTSFPSPKSRGKRDFINQMGQATRRLS